MVVWKIPPPTHITRFLAPEAELTDVLTRAARGGQDAAAIPHADGAAAGKDRGGAAEGGDG